MKHKLYAQFIHRHARNDTGRHVASVLLGVVELGKEPINGPDVSLRSHPATPTKCSVCDYIFVEEDAHEALYLPLSVAHNSRKYRLLTPKGALQKISQHKDV